MLINILRKSMRKTNNTFKKSIAKIIIILYMFLRISFKIIYAICLFSPC